MLKKLTRYELKACMRSCAVVYAAIMVAAILLRVFMEMPYGVQIVDISRGVTVFVYMLLIMTVFIMTFVVIAQRFYKNLLGDEGYLMFTLPVTNAQHIWSKLIVSFVLNVCAVLVTAVSVFVLLINDEVLRNIRDVIREFLRQDMWGLLVVEFLIMMVLSTLCGVLVIYMCISLGHMAKRHRLGAAFGAYFVVSIVMQIVTQVCGAVADAAGFYHWMNTLSNTNQAQVFLLGMSVFCLIQGVISFFVTRHVLDRKLNLE